MYRHDRLSILPRTHRLDQTPQILICAPIFCLTFQPKLRPMTATTWVAQPLHNIDEKQHCFENAANISSPQWLRIFIAVDSLLNSSHISTIEYKSGIRLNNTAAQALRTVLRWKMEGPIPGRMSADIEGSIHGNETDSNRKQLISVYAHQMEPRFFFILNSLSAFRALDVVRYISLTLKVMWMTG